MACPRYKHVTFPTINVETPKPIQNFRIVKFSHNLANLEGVRRSAVLHISPPRPLKFGYYVAGIYDNIGTVNTSRPLFVSWNSIFPLSAKRLKNIPAKRNSGAYVYAGVYSTTFGHFITEALPNLVSASSCLSDGDTRKILFVLRSPGNPTNRFKSTFERLILAKLGIEPTQIVFVTKPATYENVEISTSPFIAKYSHDRKFLSKLNLFRQKRQPDRRKST